MAFVNFGPPTFISSLSNTLPFPIPTTNLQAFSSLQTPTQIYPGATGNLDLNTNTDYSWPVSPSSFQTNYISHYIDLRLNSGGVVNFFDIYDQFVAWEYNPTQPFSNYFNFTEVESLSEYVNGSQFNVNSEYGGLAFLVNVQSTDTATPEPNTMGLIAVSLLLLSSGLKRHRRK